MGSAVQSYLQLLRLLQMRCLYSDSLQAADRLYCRCDATMQIDRERGLTSSCDTRTDANLRDNYLSMSGSDPSHREVGRQTVSCITCPPPAIRTPAQRWYRQQGILLHDSAQRSGRRPTLGHSRHSAKSWPHASRLQAS